MAKESNVKSITEHEFVEKNFLNRADSWENLIIGGAVNYENLEEGQLKRLIVAWEYQASLTKRAANLVQHHLKALGFKPKE